MIFLMPHITFPARFEFLDEIREFVADVAREGGFTEKEIYSLQLAADEAATNIIEHAYADIPDADFDVTCDMQGRTLVIVMRDTGISFDISKVKRTFLNVRSGDLACISCENSWTKSVTKPIPQAIY